MRRKNPSVRSSGRRIVRITGKGLAQQRLREALAAGFGAWKDEDHPELNGPDGTEGWIRQLREVDDRRLEEMLREPEAPH